MSTATSTATSTAMSTAMSTAVSTATGHSGTALLERADARHRDELDARGPLVRPAAVGRSRGEEAAWQELHARYDRMLHGIARSFRLASAQADDAVQTTWLLLVLHAGSVRDPARVGAWLATTLRRTCLQALREREREQLASALDRAACTPCFDADVIRAEGAAVLWRAVDELPARQRQLIRMLFAADELSYDEIAAELSMPKGAIGPTRLRALRRLRTALEDAGVHLHDLTEDGVARPA